MADFSRATITFLIDFDIDYGCKLSYIDENSVFSSQEWTWVATRSASFEVTTGVPTVTPGQTTTTFFDSAFDLDNPVGFTTSRNVNAIEIISQVEGFNFDGLKCTDASGTRLVEGVDFTIVFDNYVAPVDYSNIEFALVNSPHYVNIPFNFTTTTSATINLYVWDGALASVPVTPSYTLTIPRPSTNFSEFNVDLAKLIQEQLNPKPVIDLALTTQVVDSTSNSVKWVYFTASYTDAVESISDIQGTFVAVDGYGYYNEGVNPTKPSDNILTLASIRKVSRDGFILFPFINNGVITSIDIDSATEINATEVITGTDNSTDMVQYLEVDVSASLVDEYITITTLPAGDVITYEVVDECRYDPKQIVFKNKYGVYDCLTVFKKSNVSTNVNSSNFINNYISGGTYDTTKHQNQKINITATKSIKVNSGYISEVENTLYEQMLYSDTVYFYEGGALVPINVKSSSLEFKTRVNDKLVNYELELEYAYNTIQNV